jgi:iron complex outermembrane receptor protein
MGYRFSGVVMCLVLCTPTWALDLNEQRQFDIPAQKLSTALVEFSRQAKAPIVSSTHDVEHFDSPGVTGRMSLKEALKALLHGTGLDIRTTESGAIAVGSFGAKISATEGVSTDATRVAELSQRGEGSGPQGSSATAGSAPGDAAEKSALSEIIVTAQKREERLQDVPMSLTALSGEALVRSQAFRFEDYAGTVPGLTLIDYGAVGSQLVIRGLSTGQFAINSSVATYIDETPFTSQGVSAASYSIAPNLDTFDMQRIEVLKGPQGTLYGANALGGLLKYVTNAPDPAAFAATAESGVSSVTNGSVGFDIHGMVNLPLSSESALRLVGYDTYYPGFIDDPSRGLKDINGAHVSGGRASLLFLPTADFSIRFNALYQERTWGDFSNEDVNPNTLTPLYGNLIQEHLISQPGHANTQLYNITMNWDAGFAKILSTSSYSNDQPSNLFDDSTLYGALISEIFGKTYGFAEQYSDRIESYTQEVRISSSGDAPLEWQVGGYYTNQSAKEFASFAPIDVTTRTILYNFPTNLGEYVTPVTYHEYAGFANLDYHITPTWDVAVGGRYSANDQTFRETATGLLFGNLDFTTDSSQSVFTYSADLRWHVTPQTMLYARTAEGFVPGGPNDVVPTALTVNRTYESSTTVNYEAGLKSSLLEDRLTVEVSAFDIVWKKIQLEAEIGGYDTTTNGGRARSDGVEWNLAYVPIRGLTLDFNGAYTDARLTQPTPASVNGQVGDRLPSSPLWQSSAAANYAWPLVGEYSAFAGASWRFLGSRFADFEAIGPRQEMPKYEIFDLRGGIETKKLSLAIYVKNVGNKIAINYLQPETLLGGLGPQSAVVYTPRTVGAQLTAKF